MISSQIQFDVYESQQDINLVKGWTSHTCTHMYIFCVVCLVCFLEQIAPACGLQMKCVHLVLCDECVEVVSCASYSCTCPLLPARQGTWLASLR